MREILIRGALGLLLINFIFFVITYKKETNKHELLITKLNKPTRKINSIVIDKNGTILKLKFSSEKFPSLTSSLKEIQLKIKFKEGNLFGKSKKGLLIGKKVVLSNFKGQICNQNIEAKKLIIYLSDFQDIILQKFLITGNNRYLRGIAKQKLNLNNLCQFFKGKRKSPK